MLTYLRSPRSSPPRRYNRAEGPWHDGALPRENQPTDDAGGGLAWTHSGGGERWDEPAACWRCSRSRGPAANQPSRSRLRTPGLRPTGTATTGTGSAATTRAGIRRLYPESVVDVSALTHLIVGTRRAREGRVPSVSAWVIGASSERAQLVRRAHAADRKALLMLGGVGDGDAFLLEQLRRTATAVRRQPPGAAGPDRLRRGRHRLGGETSNSPETRRRLLALVHALRRTRPGSSSPSPPPGCVDGTSTRSVLRPFGGERRSVQRDVLTA